MKRCSGLGQQLNNSFHLNNSLGQQLSHQLLMMQQFSLWKKENKLCLSLFSRFVQIYRVKVIKAMQKEEVTYRKNLVEDNSIAPSARE